MAKPKPWRCTLCGRIKEDHHGITCIGSMGTYAGENTGGGAKVPRKEPKKS